MTTTTTKLICPECRHENEAERIYCHECGAKLDRAKVVAAKPADARVKERKRVRNMFDARRVKIRLFFFKVAKLILGSCAAAAVVQMILPPDVPPANKDVLALSQIGLEIETAVTYHKPNQLQYTEDQINEYLTSNLKSKRKMLNKPMIDFNRALVRLEEGKCGMTVERAIFGYSLYTSTSLGVQLADGKFNISSKGGAIGRLPVHPQIMKYLNIAFADVWSAMDRERRLILKADAIEFHDKSVVIVTAAPQ
jgi:hypothetical protein